MGHDPGMKSRVHPKYKTKHRVTNWAHSDKALVPRGDITLWISHVAIASWKPAPTGLRGAQRKFSDHAIKTALTLRLVFKLPLRQAEGFLRSLLSRMGVHLEAPDHTTLSRRGQRLDLALGGLPTNEPIHLIVVGMSSVAEGEAGQWVFREELISAPLDARCALVKGVISKSEPTGEFVAYFDDFFLVPEPNLLLNSHFDEDLSSWTAEGLLTADWDPMDVDGSALSGSALLRNIASGAGFVRGLQQCVEVTPGASYDVGGWVYVAEAQATAGVAFVDLSWRMDPDCSGFISAGPDSPHVSTEGQWVFTEARDVTAPANAQGASIRLTTQKLDAGGEFAAFFDDVSIVPVPEPSATLLSGAALVALAALRRARIVSRVSAGCAREPPETE